MEGHTYNTSSSRRLKLRAKTLEVPTAYHECATRCRHGFPQSAKVDPHSHFVLDFYGKEGSKLYLPLEQSSNRAVSFVRNKCGSKECKQKELSEIGTSGSGKVELGDARERERLDGGALAMVVD